MRYLPAFILLLIAPALFAQIPALPRTHIYVKGTVSHNHSPFFNYSLTTYYSSGRTGTIPIDSLGRFEGSVEIVGQVQDLYWNAGNKSYNFFVCTGDTLVVNWDDADIDNSSSIHVSNPLRDSAVQAAININNTDQKLTQDQWQYFQASSDSAWFGRINDQYNQELNMLAAHHLDSPDAAKIEADIYYNSCYMLGMHSCIPGYKLKSKHNNYRILSEATFHQNARYRYFLDAYLRVEAAPLQGFTQMSGTKEEMAAKRAPWSTALRSYYTALAFIDSYEIRDWFITTSLMFNFEMDSFTSCDSVYQDFISKVKTQEYADTLKAFYAGIKHLKPGSIAPDITLKDDQGKTVSLKDFKGKAVLIDFWGTTCAPCMSDIRERMPAVHEKYKDAKIVFLNVCIGSELDDWKKTIASTPVTGVNVWSAEWMSNPMIMAYNVIAIPHYVLVDSEGKMMDGGLALYPGSTTMYDAINKALPQ